MSLTTSPTGATEAPHPATPETPTVPIEAVTAPTESTPAAPLPAEQDKASLKALVREVLETIILTVVIYLVVNFATGRFRVEGTSMEPSVHPGQYVLVDKISYRLGQPQRGDVIVFNYPLATDRDFIKRVIGLPGETVSVSGGVVSINGAPLNEPYIAAPPISGGSWTLGPDQYFVMGDNRNSSSDSRSWGPLEYKYFIGKAVLVYWPPPTWGLVPHYTYASSH